MTHLASPQMPLAVYREVAAHLRQVEGVDAELLLQTATEFEYRQSQVGGIAIAYTDRATEESRQRVAQILAYYGDRYAPWQSV
jgi:hypothetical protein